MSAPNLTVEDVENHIPNIRNVEFLDNGGQKTVFTCEINDKPFVLKFIKIADVIDDDDAVQNDIVARAKREIEIMDRCSSPYLVKLGPIRMTEIDINNIRLLYFSEQYIQGIALHKVIREEKLSLQQTIMLAQNIALAIQSLWDIGMIHRDIKPKNVIKRDDGSFVLLDAGIAFDLNSESLTSFGPVGSRLYMSPEQITTPSRSLDFRSDLFLLGILMYEALSQQHPFFQQGMNVTQVMGSIVNITPKQLMEVVPGIPIQLNRLIMRLLAKQPHLRYRSIESLYQELERLKEVI
ncbi:serine/threonine protein kinase [Xylanibacillus composti]|uniref:Protein kinase domain-containing protein n=1 Tax=Xylanibacillus composti TaxID=1572762 RepID=A0A8J4M4R1_9BACL|nr:serine/threonine-protein kinase [Xylanibacillus composti]MDT9726410.1 serine/threonine protein kinase [Xylanibacillus composti]GIQ71495.1 hypothetical protein XYCOK13_43190 [Xylanibacillus composti]